LGRLLIGSLTGSVVTAFSPRKPGFDVALTHIGCHVGKWRRDKQFSENSELLLLFISPVQLHIKLSEIMNRGSSVSVATTWALNDRGTQLVEHDVYLTLNKHHARRRNGGITPRILNLVTRRRLQVSCPGHFIPPERPLTFWHRSFTFNSNKLPT